MKKLLGIFLIIFITISFFSESDVESWKKLAEQGDAKAQYNLGVMYDQGIGVEQNYKQAFYWFKKSAEQGEANAQYNLGVMYGQGQGVLQDYKQAFYWWKKSAEQGYANAQYNLGVMYEQGQGVIEDYAKAHMWFNICEYSGDKDAAKAREKVSKLMTSQQLAEAQRMAREWVEKFEKRQNR